MPKSILPLEIAIVGGKISSPEAALDKTADKTRKWNLFLFKTSTYIILSKILLF